MSFKAGGLHQLACCAEPRPHLRAGLPDVVLLQVTATDPDGDAIPRPARWDTAVGPTPLIYVAPESRDRSALAPGERVLAKLRPVTGAELPRYEGRAMRRLAEGPADARLAGEQAVSKPPDLWGSFGVAITTARPGPR